MNQIPNPQIRNRPLDVLVVGAGTGGLCLAQGLKAKGISVQVFERDLAPFDRQAGYRLSINPIGNRGNESKRSTRYGSPVHSGDADFPPCSLFP